MLRERRRRRSRRRRKRRQRQQKGFEYHSAVENVVMGKTHECAAARPGCLRALIYLTFNIYIKPEH
jgi:hypothetical protein